MRTRASGLLLLASLNLLGQSAFNITTVAGSDATGDGAAAILATLSTPEGIAADGVGNIYIVDSAGHRVRRVDRQGRIETVAGNGSAGFRGDGGPAALSVINAPYGVAAAPDGAILVADFGNGKVRRIAPGGGAAMSTLLADLKGPRNVAVDLAGDLFVSDYLAHRIYRLPAGGRARVQVIAGTGEPGHNGDGPALSTQLSYPAGLAVDAAGVLYVADSGNKLVRRIAGGLVSTVLGGPGSAASLATPAGLALDRAGNLYVADSSARRLYRRSPDGAVATVGGAGPEFDEALRDVAVDSDGSVYFSLGRRVMKLASPAGATAPVVVAGSAGNAVAPRALQSPIGVAVDNTGSLFIADERAALVRRLAPDGSLQTVAGGGALLNDGGAATAAKLTDPVAVAWDAVAGLRIVDYQGNRVRGLLASGKIYTVAGDGEPGFRGDGSPAGQSRLNRPRGAAFDPAGNLYIADSLNHRIRKVGANGFISTVVGTGTRGYYGDGGPAVQAQLNTPHGVAADTVGNVYIADTGNNVVRRLSADGMLSTVAGSGAQSFSGDGGPATQAALNSPISVAFDAQGRLLIADTFNHRIRRINAVGIIETIAGDGGPGFWGDGGAAVQAQLNSPAALATDSAGRIFIADLDNNRVRRLDPEETATLPPPAPAAGDVITTGPAELVVMNAASLRSGPITAGAILALFASGIGPAAAVQAGLTGGRLPFSLGGVEVRIAGLPAALFYAGPGQINAEAPRALQPQAAALVEVIRSGVTLAAARVEVRFAQPALFTRGAGTGQALAVNEDGSLNSEENPAARGSLVTLFATGDGETEPLGVDGVPSGNPPPRPLQAVEVLVGQAHGDVLFAGRAPGFVGLFQVNVQLPGIFTPPGVRPLTLTVGRVASQPGVTISVK